MALRHSTCLDRCLVASRNWASSCDSRLPIDASPWSIRFCASSPSVKYSGGANCAAAIPTIPAFEPLGQLACHIKPGLVRPIEGQTDHDGRVCHQKLSAAFLRVLMFRRKIAARDEIDQTVLRILPA